MVELNIPNFFTIAFISLAGYAAIKWALVMLGIDIAWL